MSEKQSFRPYQIDHVSWIVFQPVVTAGQKINVKISAAPDCRVYMNALLGYLNLER